MICPKCSAETTVVECRKYANGATSGLRRRRECVECGHRFTSLETLVVLGRAKSQKPRQLTEEAAARKRARQAVQRAQRTPEERKAIAQRDRLRKMARLEAAETGRPIDEILAAWSAA